jgi:hypothetical protein
MPARFRDSYAWIRALYFEHRRLPLMVVRDWVPDAEARTAEQALIHDYLRQGMCLLNCESARVGKQLVLI